MRFNDPRLPVLTEDDLNEETFIPGSGINDGHFPGSVFAKAKYGVNNIDKLDPAYDADMSDEAYIVVKTPTGPKKYPASLVATGGSIGEAVARWLDENPEATTTVEDNSITYEKLVNGTLNFVTPEMFGAKGDGVADDTAAIQEALNSNEIVVFRNTTYLVSVPVAYGSALILNNNQKVVLGCATIKLQPNSFDGYKIFNVNGASGVSIIGGTILGDRDEHSGVSGEWGHGVNINGSNFEMHGTSVFKCWGDGAVCANNNGNVPSKIFISDCHFEKCRRQGVSVINANNVKITGCSFVNIDGTAPMSAVDVEPNANQTVDNVIIGDCIESGCASGFITAGNRSNNAVVKNVKFVNCIAPDGINTTNSDDTIIQNCTTNVLSIGRNSTNGKVFSTKMKELHLERNSEASLYDCNIEYDGDNMRSPIAVYPDGPSDKKCHYIRCYNCIIKSSSTSEYCFRVRSSGILETAEFNNCLFVNSSGNSIPFTWYIDFNLVMSNCKIEMFSGWYSDLLTIRSTEDVGTLSVRLQDCLFVMPANIRIFSITYNKLDLYVSNCEINRMTRFMKISDNITAEGVVKLLSNIFTDTSLLDYDYVLGTNAVDNLNKFGGNSVFTSVQ